MSTVIGIDLGTTHSCVAAIENGTPQVMRGPGGEKKMPSVVAFTDGGARLVGHAAKRQSVKNALHTMAGAKRLVGRRWAAPGVREIVAGSPCTLTEGPHGDVRAELRARRYAMPELQAFVLQELRLLAEARLGHPVERAVIAVPACFDDGQRRATQDAGRIAGLEVLRIVNEPTAAALAYGFRRDLDCKLAVLDLGGGTCEVAVLATCDEVFEVIAAGGDASLGGDDFDRRVVDWLADGFRADHGIELRDDRVALARLKDGAERARHELSTATATEINLPFIVAGDRADALHLVRELTREALERLTVDLVERTVALCARTMRDARIAPGELDALVLVGGMTRMPAVAQAVTGFFGRAAADGVDRDEAVALGAAIQGASLMGVPGIASLVLDVTPLALGLRAANGAYHPLVARNSTVPCSSAWTLTTPVGEAPGATKIVVAQGSGDGDAAADDAGLGELELDLRGPRSSDASGVTELDVTFDVSVEGMLTVSARDHETGRRRAITIRDTGALTDEEILPLVAASRDELAARRATAPHDEPDRRRRGLQNLIRAVEALWPRAEPLIAIGDMGLDALAQASDSLVRARSAANAGDPGQIADLERSLQRTLQLFQIALRRGGAVT